MLQNDLETYGRAYKNTQPVVADLLHRSNVEIGRLQAIAREAWRLASANEGDAAAEFANNFVDDMAWLEDIDD